MILNIDNLCSLCNAGFAQGSGIKKKVYTLLLFVHKLVGLKRMKRFYEKILSKLTVYKEGGIASDSEAGVGRNNFYKSSDWKEPIKTPFEGKMFNIPKDYDSILKMWYGNYMKLPPEDQRHSHEYYKMYWR